MGITYEAGDCLPPTIYKFSRGTIYKTRRISRFRRVQILWLVIYTVNHVATNHPPVSCDFFKLSSVHASTNFELPNLDERTKQTRRDHIVHARMPKLKFKLVAWEGLGR